MDGRVFIAHALAPVAVGLAAGLAGALALGRTMSGMLFSVSPGDPVTLAAVVVALLAAATLATCVPLRRAHAVDLPRALRA